MGFIASSCEIPIFDQLLDVWCMVSIGLAVGSCDVASFFFVMYLSDHRTPSEP
jgi:hypothetical protein